MKLKEKIKIFKLRNLNLEIKYESDRPLEIFKILS